MNRTTQQGRRTFIAALGATLAGAALPAWAKYQPDQFRIGYQKAASTLVLLKAHGSLEKRLAPLGLKLSWTEFPAGPQLLEGLNVGAIDFGYVGEAPPVFAQAAGADFVYTAYEIPTPHAEGVVVARNSPIQRVADLKGKKVAFNRGSDVHWFIVALLRKNGLDFGDIQPVYLAPADARAALERGSIDAWAIWDPFLAAVLAQSNARLLADAQNVASHHQFFLSQREFAQKRKDVIAIAMEELGKEGQWVRQNPSAAAAQLAPIQGLDAGIIEAGLKHYEHIYKPVDADVLAEQQRIADTFYELKLIPRRIVTKDAVLA
ncbi:sulfonate ABC transporter substrate-binding protein [Paraburkholderia caballeronis]|uniref:Putative aliphatic sulfonates-binding protein n=1 Tax=Paraburkholderia caballeronis TaxID=416943 RepID=A0A1H7NRG6_9BURK|nr:sulfonate ABC transporter substrate-binding protein [Paraburkholderia caballeronis]PXW25583.1 sulfonate transport system substrate-binding protein [Paraburkholderia caballeronis]PXX01190.1 sulfonate transport system substrate-binding protein [Paraburkholderia caballeronis]RAJ99457.1 sulfonate transport system substrate-binding protein [Paraburkholderia caballeronis]TDV25601.1 sulfonate transport system substrate-binding protein [Paraburkholderia caballeronis]SEE31356.1 sulfonate transport s